MKNNEKIGAIFNSATNDGIPVILVKELTKDEKGQLIRMEHRINTVANEARRLNVRVMVDAEETFMQPALTRYLLFDFFHVCSILNLG